MRKSAVQETWIELQDGNLVNKLYVADMNIRYCWGKKSLYASPCVQSTPTLCIESKVQRQTHHRSFRHANIGSALCDKPASRARSLALAF